VVVAAGADAMVVVAVVAAADLAGRLEPSYDC